jgi:phosphonate transport system permease protein
MSEPSQDRPSTEKHTNMPEGSSAPEIAAADRRGQQLPGILRAFVGIGFLALVVWSFAGIRFDFRHLSEGLSQNNSLLRQMFPHSRADWLAERVSMGKLLADVAATIQMAVVGTVIGMLPAFPLSFLAARTTSLFRPIANVTKTALNIGRAIPTFIYALVIIGIVGLGVQAGAAAIAMGSFFMLAKLYAEALETVQMGPIEAVRAAGGNPAQVFVFGMLPQVFPNFLSATLYCLELNLQASFIVGFVGGGGIGYQLYQDAQLFQWLEVGLLVALLIVLVNVVDYASYQIRRMFA